MKSSLNITIDSILRLRKHPLKVSDLIRTAKKFDLDQIQMASLAGVSPRAFTNKAKLSLLSIDASEKVLRLEALYKIGLDVFDSNKGSFRNWLKSKIPALENHIPNDLLTSVLGMEVVNDELLRIEHNIF